MALAAAAVVVGSFAALVALPGGGDRGEQPSAGAVARPRPETPDFLVQGEMSEVDPASLPDVEASHLVINDGSDLQFIHLESGARSVQAIGGLDVFKSVFPVERGVVVTKSGIDRPVYVPVVGEPVDLTDPDSDFRTWPIGVTEDTVYYQGELKVDDAWHTTIGAVSLTGEPMWQQVRPFGLGAVGVTTAGDVIANAGGRIFAISESGNREVGVGVVHAVIDDLVVVDNCDEDLTCGIDALDVSDGSVTHVSADWGFVEHRGGSPSFVLWSQNGGPQVFAVVNGRVSRLDIEPDSVNGELGLAVDPSGAAAVAHFREVTLVDPSGYSVDIEFDRNRCCMSRVGVAFLTLSD